jgi:hypothetical protein
MSVMGVREICDEKGLEAGPSVRGEIPLIAKCAMSGAPGHDRSCLYVI